MEEDIKKYALWCYELLNGDDSNADEIWETLEADGFIGRNELWLGEDEDE